jgi:hypothetical protein
MTNIGLDRKQDRLGWGRFCGLQPAEASGGYARILQHEIDHLNGMLYIDRMQARSFSSLENYTKHWKDKQRTE